MKIKKPTFHQILLLIIPAIMTIVGISFLLQISPIYAGASGYDQDPAYVYLFSGLTILDGQSPYHIDHPGTPLQVLVAIVIFINWVFLWLVGGVNEDVIGAVLSQPELYMVTICIVLLVLNASALYYLGRRVFQSIHDIRMALVFQTAPFLFWIVAPRVVYLSPEALLIYASVLLLGLLVPTIFASGDSEKSTADSTITLAGIVCGFGVAVKITFIPMLGLLFLLGERIRIFHGFKFAVITFMICMLPILSGLGRMVDRFYFFAIHSGKYGSGKADVIDIDELPGRMLALFEWFPLFYAVLIILIVLLILKGLLFVVCRYSDILVKKPLRYSYMQWLVGWGVSVTKWNISVPLVLVSVGVFQTLLVLKHPGPHYMVPVLPIVLLSVVWMALVFKLKQRAKSVLLLLCCLIGMISVSVAFYDLRNNRFLINESNSTILVELEKHENPLLIGAYRCMLPECALTFGVSYAPSLRKKTAPFLLNFYEYNIWNKKLLVQSEGWVALDRVNKIISEGRPVFLVSPKDYSSMKLFSLETIVTTPIQSLYRVKSALVDEL